MLGHTYRYQVHNGSGSTVVVTVKERAWKFASDGSRTDASESTRVSAASMGSGTYSNSSTIDNSSVKNLGAHLTALFDVSGSVTGALTVFVQHSTDGGSTWPSDGGGIPVGSYYFNASSVDHTRNFEV